MRKNLLTRSVAVLSGVAMLTALAACGDNTAAPTGDNTGNSNTSSAEAISGEFKGAGASSQQAAVEAWVAGFQGTNPDAKIGYDPSGSGAGVSTFLTGATAWAGSDASLSADQIEQSKSVCASGTAFDIPVYISPIAVVFNLKGVSDEGKHVNPITVVHRSDKSGTTQNFVSYFIDTVPDAWPYELSENWPNEVGQGAKGTSGVISTVQQADGTIGYADFSQVGDLGTVAVKVGEEYVEISAEAGSKVIDDSELDSSAEGENRVVVKLNHNTSAEGAYPIVLVSYDIACPAYKDADTAKFVKSWLTYVVSEEGQQTASQNAGSAPLPDSLRETVMQSIDAIETE